MTIHGNAGVRGTIRRAGRYPILASLVAFMLVVSSSAAFADDVFSDGDGLTPVGNNNMSLGTVCVNSTTTKTALVAIRRNGGSGTPNVYKDSSSVSISVPTVTGAGLSQSLGSPTTIALPSNWNSLATNSISVNTVSSVVTFVAGASPGAFSGSIVYRGDGVNSSNTAISNTDTMNVTATVSNTGACAPANQAPTVDAGGSYAGSEGAAVALDGSVDDPDSIETTLWTYALGGGFDAGATCTFGDAAAVDTTVSCTDDGPVTLSLTANDGVNAAVSDTATLTVSNEAPSISNVTNNGPIDEGGAATATASATDAGANDPLSYGFDCDDDGTYEVGPQASNQTSCSFDQDGTYTVGAKVTDGDGGQAVSSTDVTVRNVAPSVDALTLDPTSTTETGSIDLDATVSDPGADDTTLSYTITWGDGATTTGSTTDGTIEESHIYADDDDDDLYTVTLTVTDSDDEDGQETADVTVSNVNPEISAVSNDGPIDEGGSAQITVTASDIAGANDPLSYGFDCDDDGTYEVGPQASNQTSCSFDQDGTYTVGAKVTDGDGGQAVSSTDVTVRNVAPSVDALTLDPTSTTETGSIDLDATVSDPGADDTTLSYTITWGDGATTTGSTTDGTIEESHIYADDDDDDLYTVTLTVTDSDDEDGQETADVTVSNVNPEISAVSNDGPIDEGGSAQITVTASDIAGANDPLSYGFDCDDDGTYEVGPQASNQTSCSFDQDGTYTVGAKVTDGDGGQAVSSTDVTVRNVAPSVDALTLDPTSTTETGSIDLDATVSDPGADDTTLSYTITWGDGATTTGSTTDGTIEESHIYADDDDDDLYTVTLTVTDSDDEDGQETADVTVSNVNPEISAVSNDGPIDEGGSAQITVTASDIAGANDPLSYGFDCDDDGTYEVGPQASNQTSCSFDQDGTYTVGAKVTDGDGGQAVSSTDVTVRNVAPSVDALTLDPTSTTETGSIDLDATVSDPGADDTTLSYTITWGDGATTTGSTTDGTIEESHIYADDDDDDLYTVTLTVTDSDDEDGQETADVTVSNVNPEISAVSNDGPIDEGGSAQITVTASDIAGANDPLSYGFDCDDDGTYEVGPQASNQTSCSFDQDGTYTVGAKVTDGDGGQAVSSTDVTVRNVAPHTLSASFTSASGSCASRTATLNAGFVDPGADADWSAVVDWGDGSSQTITRSTPGVFSTSHTYALAGSYVASFTVTDDDATSAPVSATFTVNYTTTGYLAPINNSGHGEAPSIFKFGSVIPVKVRFTNCDGTTPSNLAPTLSVRRVSASTPAGVDETVASAGSANTGDLLRWDGVGQYIYNLSTKAFSNDSSSTWTLKVTVPGTGQTVETTIGLKK